MPPKTAKRNINLDVLRNLAMLMVVAWHFYVRGLEISGVYANDILDGNTGMANYLFSQFVVVFCSACVNLFVMISGYFLVSKPFNWKRVILLWLEVLFYGVAIGILFYFLQPGSVSVGELLSYLRPVTGDNYWFFQKYFGLVCLAPFLSAAVNNLSQVQYKRFLLAMFLVGCTITGRFPFGEIMVVSKGFSLIWFIFLFFWGGYLRRFPVQMTSRQAFYACLVTCVLGFCFILSKALFRHALVFETPSYNGFGFFVAIFVFVWISKKDEISTSISRLMADFVPFLFGVYIISEHPILMHWLWKDLYDWPSLINSVWFIPIMFVTVVGIFLSCILIDAGRTWLFRVAGVEKFAAWLGRKGEGLVGRICGAESQVKE